ncbi:MAG: DEAD/DEAH box helicase [Flavobacteriales bacterium]|jgi:predicted helicase
MSLEKILEKYRLTASSEKDKGDKFERLIQAFFKSDSLYRDDFISVDLWKDFKYKQQFGDIDLGIDLVGYTKDGKYWAIQCKFYADDAKLSSHNVQGLLSEGGKQFKDDEGNLVQFSVNCLVSTAYMGINAQKKTWNRTIEFIDIHRGKLEKSDVDWEALDRGIYGKDAQLPKKNLRPHQTEALNYTNIHFQSNDRGKLIMACGTGKTFTALRIAEKQTNNKGTVLFLVPSIALLGQTLREWKSDTETNIHAICICSDPEISKKIGRNEEMDTDRIDELAYPASTDVDQVLQQFENIKNRSEEGMTVVFSTYQSIDVISKSQKKLLENGFPEFDLIICDEAHRTTGVTLAGNDESTFTKVHNNDFLKSKKRLYMTATPRLFSDDSKSKAAQYDAVLCSMDDESLYGEEIYRIGFGEAVEKDLLTDYKVLILTLSDQDIPPSIQSMISSSENEINMDDAAKLIGCINALSKEVLGDSELITESDPEPMKRAVAFCQNIKASKKIGEVFNSVSTTYIDSLPENKRGKMVSLTCKHIDGTMSAPDKDNLLGWLKKENKEKECRILTNVRVLSEGVDVPSLDAVLFLSSRNSQVDVVQSVGRVMRKSPGKKYGYIIIPVVVPSDVEPDQALNDNERFKVVWSVLNALRAHDDRFNATINKIDLNKKKPAKIIIGGSSIKFGPDGKPIEATKGGDEYAHLGQQMRLHFDELQSVVFAKMVEKVGERRYWEQWAKDVAIIAEKQIDRIKRLIHDEDKHQKAFEQFVFGLRKNINPSISEPEAIDLLSQHIITKPVFDALFEGYSFVKNNPISKAMQGMLDLLEEQAIEKETKELERFYQSVKMRASGIDNAEGKQRIIIELYDKFFKTAFPKMVEQLGIVYTPIECVDFILHSVNDILKKEFGRRLTDEGIHIMDPFTGTGTFITRLLQSGLIDLKDLDRKYQHELHANEIVLLAYYIATINIENAYHDATPEEDGIGTTDYTQFDGIVLTDTFQLAETEHGEKLFSEMFPQNSERVEKQRNAPLNVIIGNPPYSIGQKSANDNAQNQSYPKLDARIAETYAKLSDAGLNKSLYDAYIKAFRWTTDRLDDNGGIICFISNGAWLDGNSTDGFRKSLEKEFTSIYVFNLRGNARTSGELRQKEGGGVFGLGSRTPIAITLLVKNPSVKSEKATIYYHDIGDYLTQTEKLNMVREVGSVANEKMDWKILKPNEHGDWISMRNESFDSFIELKSESEKKLKNNSYFDFTSSGLATSRDAWCYNFSENLVDNNVNNSISFYNEQARIFIEEKILNPNLEVENFIDLDSTKISWDRQQKKDVAKGKQYTYERQSIITGIYRPYHKQKVYFNRNFNNCVYQLPKLFPSKNSTNLVILTSGKGDSKDFSVLISNLLPCYDTLGKTQVFPLYYYEENKDVQQGLFETDDTSEVSASGKYIRRDGVSYYILEKAKQQYKATNITKEDIFYYVYGFLHSPEYRETFANDLKKMLPRLPLVEDVKDFWAFSKTGRQLAEIHLNYESVPPYEGVKVEGEDSKFFKVEKMRFPKKDQKDIIYFNSQITISNIPKEAYEYVVNGKSAIEWIMERYQITTHKESQITNDPNDWAEEVGNPRYILDLLLSIINVSMQTRDLIGKLPKMKFE